MAQLRQDYSQLVEQNTEVVVVGPEGPKQFAEYFEENDLPFTGLPDPEHSVLKRYGQEVNLFKMGRMPAMAIIDQEGVVRFVHYGKSMSDIPENDEVLRKIKKINQEMIKQG